MKENIKALQQRIVFEPKKLVQLIVIMDGAINEIQNAGCLRLLPEETQQRIHSAPPEERVTLKTMAAEAYVEQAGIVSDGRGYTSEDGTKTGMQMKVFYDPRFLNAICTYLLAKMEVYHTMLESGFLLDASEIWYRIETDAAGEDLATFREKLEQLESFYPEARFLVEPMGSAESSDEADGAVETPDSSDSKGSTGETVRDETPGRTSQATGEMPRTSAGRIIEETGTKVKTEAKTEAPLKILDTLARYAGIALLGLLGCSFVILGITFGRDQGMTSDYFPVIAIGLGMVVLCILLARRK